MVKSRKKSGGTNLIYGITTIVFTIIVVFAVTIFFPKGPPEPVEPVSGNVAFKSKREVKKLYEDGKFKKALPALSELVERNPQDVELRAMLASSYRLNGEPGKSQKEYEEIVKIAPDNADAAYQLGILSRQADQLSEAVEYLEKAVELRPDSALFLSELAKSYVKSGLFEEAIDEWERALEAYPEKSLARAAVYAEIGDVYVMTEELSRARQAYQAGLDIQPNNEYLKTRLEEI